MNLKIVKVDSNATMRLLHESITIAFKPHPLCHHYTTCFHAQRVHNKITATGSTPLKFSKLCYHSHYVNLTINHFRPKSQVFRIMLTNKMEEGEGVKKL
jgi:hypothetical protein